MDKEPLATHQIGRYKEKPTPKNLIEIGGEIGSPKHTHTSKANIETPTRLSDTTSSETSNEPSDFYYWGADPVRNMQIVYIGSIILACFGLCYVLFPEITDSILEVLFSGGRRNRSSGFDGFGDKARAVGLACLIIAGCCFAYIKWSIKNYYK